VTNGTLALQLALRTIEDQEGEIITTPFSYVATTSAILWEKFEPVYVDIEPDTFCIDPSKIEAAITDRTRAILAVHVFGNPCDVEAIEEIAKKHNLIVIYDAAHAFGINYKGTPLFNYGDMSICSFHATKVFHTIEGGAIFTNSADINKKTDLMKRFGHNGDDHLQLGINAKLSEFHAAMGLVNLNYIDAIRQQRKDKFELYVSLLQEKPELTLLKLRPETDYNYAYFPVLFENEALLEETLTKLESKDIYARRYFYPSLNKLSYVKNDSECPISENISSRIVCLPLYADLDDTIINDTCKILLGTDEL